MKERLSDSEKTKLKDRLQQNWEVPTSQLLEKLSLEISSNFQWEENPWVYKEGIKKLLELKQKINNAEDLSNLQDEINKLSAHLSEEKKQEFSLAIKWAKEILKNSKELIEELNSDIKDDINIFNPKDWDFTTKLFGQKLINRAKNPQNMSDELIWWGIGLFNSWEAVARVTVDLLIWIWKTIPDTYKILTWKAETDAFKNV